MKVLHVETGMHLYGGALQVRYLLEGLRGKVENVLVAPRGSEIAAAVAENARVYDPPVAGEIDPRLLMGLVRAIREERPDIVHVHSRRGADLWGGVAARFSGIPSLLTRRVDNPEPKWLVRAKYGMYAKVVTISEGIRKVLLTEGIAPGRMECIPSAVDTRVYRPGGDPEWFRREFQLSVEEKVVGVIAQLISRKGHRFLIEAAPAILKDVPNTRFLVFGQGPLREELDGLCQKSGLSDRFLFAGFRRDMPRILPCLDLVVHPALMEGLGVSLLQASACGVPIVAARAGGIPEVVREGENGILVEPGTAAGLVAPIVEILRSGALADRYGRNGVELVRNRFSIESMVAGYERLYASLAEAFRGGSGDRACR